MPIRELVTVFFRGSVLQHIQETERFLLGRILPMVSLNKGKNDRNGFTFCETFSIKISIISIHMSATSTGNGKYEEHRGDL